jgi:hypothetical protein
MENLITAWKLVGLGTSLVLTPRIINRLGTSVAQWLRYCAINQKVAGSIKDGIMEIFIDKISSDRTMALGSTQPLTEMSTRRISLG